jgi:hypothetical protein
MSVRTELTEYWFFRFLSHCCRACYECRFENVFYNFIDIKNLYRKIDVEDSNRISLKRLIGELKINEI